VLNLPTLSKRETPDLNKINANQQCVLFSTDKSDGVWRVAIALRRKILVTEWNGSDFITKTVINLSFLGVN